MYQNDDVYDCQNVTFFMMRHFGIFFGCCEGNVVN